MDMKRLQLNLILIGSQFSIFNASADVWEKTASFFVSLLKNWKEIEYRHAADKSPLNPQIKILSRDRTDKRIAGSRPVNPRDSVRVPFISLSLLFYLVIKNEAAIVCKSVSPRDFRVPIDVQSRFPLGRDASPVSARMRFAWRHVVSGRYVVIADAVRVCTHRHCQLDSVTRSLKWHLEVTRSYT